MQEKLVSFETAELAKEKGFDVPTWDYFQITCAKEPSECCRPTKSNWNTYNEYEVYSRPTQSLLQKWLREAYDTNVYVTPESISKQNCSYLYHILGDNISLHFKGVLGMNYEEALEIGLYQALLLLQ